MSKFALSFLCGVGLVGAPMIAAADPLVIPGIGPQSGYRQPAPEPRTAVASASQQGDYGGGFLEFLVTGRSETPGQAALQRVPQAPAYAPTVAYAPAAAPSAYAPEAMTQQRSVDPIYLRHDVDYEGHEPAGTIIVDTPNKFLYLVEPGRRALRYGIGVGRPGFSWSGVKTISRKAEWPGWTPPPEMLKRRPDLPIHMEGGPENPLGARALYLGSSLYRIHGTNEPYTIGTNVSSGCIRMMNEDVIDLYGRVRVGTRVLVL